MNHGVFTTEQATSVTTPAVAESGVAFVVGAAPVQSAANPAKVGKPPCPISPSKRISVRERQLLNVLVKP